MDFFIQASKELDQQAASLVRTIHSRQLHPIQPSDESQLLQLVNTLATIAQAARDSLIWRCGLVTVCGDDPGVFTTPRNNNNNNSSSGVEEENNNNNSSSTGIKIITPLDSRISVISRLTDLLSLVHVASSFFLLPGCTHQSVFKKNNVVTLLNVVAGGCDVPFLAFRPLCFVILDTLNACIQDFLGVVHAEHSVNNTFVSSSTSISSSSSSASTKIMMAMKRDQSKFPRKIPFTFSIHAHRCLCKNLSRRIFQPLYGSWLHNALGSPENITPFPTKKGRTEENHNNNNNQNAKNTSVSSINNNNTSASRIQNPFSSSSLSSSSLMRTTQVGRGGSIFNNNNNNNNNQQLQQQLQDDANYSSSASEKPKSNNNMMMNTSHYFHDADGQNNNDDDEISVMMMNNNHNNSHQNQNHASFLKDAIITMIYGAFLGDGPAVSRHLYVPISLNILSTLLLIPLEDETSNSNNNDIQKSSTGLNEDHDSTNRNHNNSSVSSSLRFDKRAEVVFGPKMANGISQIIDGVLRRSLIIMIPSENNSNKSSSSSSNHHQHRNEGVIVATGLLNLTSITAAKRLMHLFWSVRPLVQMLSTCALTRKTFLNSPSTKSLFELMWKTITAMTEIIESVNAAMMMMSNNNNSNSTMSVISKQQKLFQAVTIISFSVLPIAVTLWKGLMLSSSSPSSSSFADSILLYVRKAAPILLPPTISSSNSFPTTMTFPSSSSSNNRHHSSHYKPTPQENLIAFDSLTHAVEAVSVESSSSTSTVLKDWLTQANSDVCSIQITAAANSSSSSSSSKIMNEATNHLQTQWTTLLVALGIEDPELRCVFASVIGSTPESDLPPHSLNLQHLHHHQNANSFLSSSALMMLLLVDTALRDAVSNNKNNGSSSSSSSCYYSPDMVFGALNAVGGSPLNNNSNDNGGGEDYYSSSSSSSSPAHPVLRRALLRLASFAADAVSCRDVCRVLLRSDQNIGFVSWISSKNNNDEEGNNFHHHSSKKKKDQQQVQEDSAVAVVGSTALVVVPPPQSSSSSNTETGLTASLRIELAQQKALNFDLERELHKRSNEATIQDAKIRALHETLNSMETDNNQQKVASETIHEMLNAERQQKQQALDNESNMRHEMSVMMQRMREMEQERQRMMSQVQGRIDEAERKAQIAQSRLHGVERELEVTKGKLVVSEDRVNKFLALHNTFSEMSKGV